MIGFKVIGRYVLVGLAILLVISSRFDSFDFIYVFLFQTQAELTKDIAFIIGAMFQAVYFPWRFEIERKRKKELEKSVQNNLVAIAKYYRYALNLRFKVRKQFDDISFRFFLKDSMWPTWWLKFTGRKIRFKYVKIDSIVKNKINTDLRFVVHPYENSQGLIGKSYQDVASNVKIGKALPKDPDYLHFINNMDKQQINATQNHKTVVTYAISKNERTIECMASFDSKKVIPVMSQLTEEEAAEIYELIDDFYQNIKLIIKKIR